MDEKTVMIPEDLVKLTKTYLENEIQGDVILNYCYDEDAELFNLEFIFNSVFFSNKFSLYFMIIEYLEIDKFEKLIYDDYEIIFNTCDGINKIYAIGEYIYFKYHFYGESSEAGGNDFKILKNIAIPVFEKLITIIKNHKN